VLLVSDEAETLKLTQSKGGMNQGRDGPIKGTLRPSFIVPKVGCVGECLPWSHHSRRAIYIELGAALRATRFEHLHNQEQRISVETSLTQVAVAGLRECPKSMSPCDRGDW
jgi:hypothetical protein